MLFEPAGQGRADSAATCCVENGLVMRAIRDGMVLSPPLIVTEAQIDEIVDKARRSLDETARRDRPGLSGDGAPLRHAEHPARAPGR